MGRGIVHWLFFGLLFMLVDGSMLGFYVVRQGWAYLWHTVLNTVRRRAPASLPQHYRSFVRPSEVGRGLVLETSRIFQVLEIARIHFFGHQQTLYDSIQRGNMPVLAGSLTRFLAPLRPLEPYDVEVRFVHYDHRFIYMAQAVRSLARRGHPLCCVSVCRVAFVHGRRAVDPVAAYTDTTPETLDTFNRLLHDALGQAGCGPTPVPHREGGLLVADTMIAAEDTLEAALCQAGAI